jgi:glycosyltransferase involved in cell wall biosynthesis/tetratricopeptide (TPR) repeat protein
MTQTKPTETFDSIKKLLADHQADSALAMAEQVVRDYPHEAEAHFLCAEAYRQHNNANKAIEHLKRACHLNSRSTGYVGRLGEQHLSAGQLELAIECYSKVLAIEPLAWAYVGLGNAFERQGNITETITSFEKALEINGQLPKVRERLQTLQEKPADDHSNRAAADKDHSLSSAASMAEKLDLAHLAYLERDNARALTLYTEYLSEHPNDYLAHHRVGDIYLRLRQYEKAKKHYLSVLAEQPQFPWSLHNLSLASGVSGDWVGAVHYYGQLSDSHPDFWQEHHEDYTVQKHLGYLLYYSDCLDEARRVFGHALTLMPKGWESHLGLAMCFGKRHNVQEALSTAKLGLMSCRGNLELQAFIDALNIEESVENTAADGASAEGMYFEEVTEQDYTVAVLTEDYIAASIKFDDDFYGARYPDVALAGVDGYLHYVGNGEWEGRRPNPHFDPAFYRAVNSDVRAAGISAFEHYYSFGYKEGRLPESPLKFSDRAVSCAKQALLFVGHDGYRAGSQIVLLEVIKWFYKHTTRKLKVLLLSSGPVASLYAKYAEVYVLDDFSINKDNDFLRFIKDDFELAYLNTVVSGSVFELLDSIGIQLRCDVVAHIHEMEKVLAEFPKHMEDLLKYTKLWVSASPLSSQTLINTYNIPASQVVTVSAFIAPTITKNSHGRCLRKMARETLGVSEDAFVVSGCGTVYWRKGPDLFIEAARQIKANTRQKCEFVWIGDGPDTDDLVGQLTAEEKTYIKFVGSRNDSNKMLAIADVFFLSSREDPFPLVVMESAQYAIPTVCFDEATGITEFIQADAGIAVERIDAGLAASAILSLINDKPRLKSLGDCARARLYAGYTAEKQCLSIYETIRRHTGYLPSVSVIVPFYNHEKFADERINSILNQRIKDIEIICLDDCSPDGTLSILEKYRDDKRVAIFANEKNSGSPFKQWQKGVGLASSEIIWIAEGDDACKENFLDVLLPYFDDQLVTIASAKVDIIDEHGHVVPNALKPYLDSAFQGKFDSSYIKDGFAEVNESFGAMCTLVNASGLMIRKSAIDANILAQAGQFKMVGDWLIYLSCLKAGKIAYDVRTVNYFRRHGSSVVHKIEGTEVYFAEREQITAFVFDNFVVSNRLINKAFQAIDHEWARFAYKHPGRALEQVYSKKQLLGKVNKVENKYHVAFYVHGMLFSKGGIERLAANMANYFARKGWSITVYCRVWKSTVPVYSLHNAVTVKPIFDEHEQAKSIVALRQDLLNSDVDVFIPMLSEWLFDPIVEAALHTGIPVIASEHNDPWKIEELWWSHESRVECFKKVDKIHLLLNKFTDSLPEALQDKITVIPNGIEIPDKMPTAAREKLIVGIGRLEHQKRFDRLIEAAAPIKSALEADGWRVEIYGEGSLRDALQKQINDAGLSNLVVLKGLTSDVLGVLSRASVYVMSSEFEGFGIALVEAMSQGVPSIGFKECNGPNEIIRDNVDGKLVDDVLELAITLKKYMQMDLTQMGSNAFERSKDYSKDVLFKKWADFIVDAISPVDG